MNWYKIRELWNSGYGDWQYIESFHIDSYIEELNMKYGDQEAFRGHEYHKISKPPIEIVQEYVANLYRTIRDAEKSISYYEDMLRRWDVQ